jgi:hypothetical protein
MVKRHFILRDGKKLRTYDELGRWYLAKLRKLSKGVNDFDELPVVIEERKKVLAVLNSLSESNDGPIIITDKETDKFRQELYEYLARFLNNRYNNAKPPPDYYNNWVHKFNGSLDSLLDTELRRKLIGEEIEIIKNNILQYLRIGNLRDNYTKAQYEAKQKFLEYLQGKLIETATKKNADADISKAYSQKQIAIAYEFMKIIITSQNAIGILKRHSKTTSTTKLLTKRINNVSDLTKLSGNKTADTKHLNDLKAAKRLMSGIKKQGKNKNAVADIDRIINAFQASYDKTY